MLGIVENPGYAEADLRYVEHLVVEQILP